MLFFVHLSDNLDCTGLLYFSDDESDEDENESEAHEISELKTKNIQKYQRFTRLNGRTATV